MNSPLHFLCLNSEFQWRTIGVNSWHNRECLEALQNSTIGSFGGIVWKGLNIKLASLRWLLIVVTSLVSASLPGCMADKLGESQNYRKHVAMIYNILINRCSFSVCGVDPNQFASLPTDCVYDVQRSEDN